MLIDVPLVDTVQMPVMQIIDMTFVFDGGMPASRWSRPCARRLLLRKRPWLA